MAKMVSQGARGVLSGTVPKETRVEGLPGRIRARQDAANTNQNLFARQLGVGKGALSLWIQGKRYPPKRYWLRLVAAGICTELELQAWRPSRPKRYSLRGVKLIPLAEYASRYRPGKVSSLADYAAKDKAG